MRIGITVVMTRTLMLMRSEADFMDRRMHSGTLAKGVMVRLLSRA